MTKCKRCGIGITWDDQKRQYGRAMRMGFSPAEWKEFGPMCQKYLTSYAEEQGRKEDREAHRSATVRAVELNRQFSRQVRAEP